MRFRGKTNQQALNNACTFETLEGRTLLSTSGLGVPSSLTAALATTGVQLNWKDNDNSATGYNVLRSTNGKTYSTVTTLSSLAANSYLDTTVVSGTAYDYEIQAFNTTKTSNASNAAVITTKLAAISGLTATASGPTTVQLNWKDNDASATGYNILHATDGVHFTQIAQVKSAAATTYTDASAVSGSQNEYEVVAFDASISAAASTMAASATPMSAPSSLSATAVSPTSVQLTWKDNDNSATGYYILRAADGVHFSQIAKVTSAKATSYTDGGVTSGNSYQYEVSAFDASTTSPVCAPAAVATPLVAPTALTAAATGPTTIQLTWKDNDTTAAGYNILRSSDGKTYTVLTTVNVAAATSYTDSSVASATAYHYEVQAVNGAKSSAVSAAVAISTPLAAVSGLTAAASAPTSVLLNWTDNATAATGYNILRAADGIHFNQIAQVKSATATSYADNSAVSGSALEYEIVAFNAATTAPACSAASVTTPLAAPGSLTASATGPSTVQLTWKDNDASAAGYNILRSTDGVHFTQLAKVTTAKATSYTDSTAPSATPTEYEVVAYDAATASAASAIATAVTPPAAPFALTATAAGPTTVNLAWADTDPRATGYVVLRTTNFKTWTAVGTLSSASANSYTDSTCNSFTGYFYEIEATIADAASAPSADAGAMTGLFAPSGLNVTGTTSSSVSLTWTENDPNAAGYFVLRSTNGTTFTQVGKTSGASVVTYTDATAASSTTYTYEIQAYNGTISSMLSNTVSATTLIPVPTALTASASGTSVALAWAGGVNLTGYNVLRSTDGNTFTLLTSLSGAATASYTDTAVTIGVTYWYEIQAVNGSATSSSSAKASATVQAQSNGVTLTGRFGDELVITESGKADSVTVDQSGSTLTILADGQTFTQPVPAAGIFLYTRGGADTITVDPSVTDTTTAETIDGAVTTINAGDPNMNVWCDSNDIVNGTAIVHRVASFAGGVSKALGASLPDPKDSGSIIKTNLSLFGTGPVAADVNQGEVGDCYFLATLAAFANTDPSVLTGSAADMGDGTYTVQFGSPSTPTYVRVNSDMPAGGFGGYMYAHPGANDTLWPAVMEKAFCYYRAGANTYASINSGWMQEVYGDLGVDSNNVNMNDNESTFYSLVSTALADGNPVTFGTFEGAANLVGGHAYTLVNCYQDSSGTHYVFRNPWGMAGTQYENAQGYVTLTFAQISANFDGGTYAIA